MSNLEAMLHVEYQTGQSSSTQHVILHGVSWETYERLLSEHEGNSGIHFAYDQGNLEIMVLSARHELLKHALALLVDIFAEELEIDICGAGSTTFRREGLARGFEPDACYYIEHAKAVRGKAEIDLTVDPPPDLIIEIDITSPSLNKFPIYAAMGIQEIWRYDGERIGIFTLTSGQYLEQAESTLLLKVTGALLTEFLDTSQQMERPTWLRRIRGWARTQYVKQKPGNGTNPSIDS